ncbi:hypothetical protein [Streptomyces kaniharaensis]|uniref:hypothetical protein n=1 Tax=Streptomyces kaniharaensis TaxID=212423 RepID=UPI0012980F4B|nr:hypothetical protein [Streptomyces kaniharaensis]
MTVLHSRNADAADPADVADAADVKDPQDAKATTAEPDLREDLGRYAELGAFTLTADTHAWYAAVDTIATPEDARAASTALAELRGCDLQQTWDAVTALAADAKLDEPDTVAKTALLVEMLQRVHRTSTILTVAAYDADLDALTAATADSAWRRERGIKLSWLRARVLRKQAAALATDRRTRREDLHEALTSAEIERRAWAVLAPTGTLPAAPADGALVERTAQTFDAINAGLRELARVLPDHDLDGIAFGDLVDLVERLAADEGTLYRLPTIRGLRTTLEEAGLGELLAELAAAQADRRAAEAAYTARQALAGGQRDGLAEAAGEEPAEEPVAEVETSTEAPDVEPTAEEEKTAEAEADAETEAEPAVVSLPAPSPAADDLVAAATAALAEAAAADELAEAAEAEVEVEVAEAEVEVEVAEEMPVPVEEPVAVEPELTSEPEAVEVEEPAAEVEAGAEEPAAETAEPEAVEEAPTVEAEVEVVDEEAAEAEEPVAVEPELTSEPEAAEEPVAGVEASQPDEVEEAPAAEAVTEVEVVDEAPGPVEVEVEPAVEVEAVVEEPAAEPEAVEEAPAAEVEAEVEAGDEEPVPAEESAVEPEPVAVAEVEVEAAPAVEAVAEEPAAEPEVVEEAPASAAEPAGRPAKPDFTPGRPVTAYSAEELLAVVRWVDGDGVERSDEELLRAAMKELGFGRLGPRIKEALGAAVSAARS